MVIVGQQVFRGEEKGKGNEPLTNVTPKHTVYELVVIRRNLYCSGCHCLLKDQTSYCFYAFNRTATLLWFCFVTSHLLRGKQPSKLKKKRRQKKKVTLHEKKGLILLSKWSQFFLEERWPIIFSLSFKARSFFLSAYDAWAKNQW